jgi:two-component system nitrogen regulation response regulator GlnG
MRYLSTLSWSGNVRQLENVCHWLTVMAPGQNIEIADLPPDLREDQAAAAERSWQEALGREADKEFNRGEQGVMTKFSLDFEKILIACALKHTAGRRIEAATLLGLGRNTLTRKIQELGLEPNSGPESRVESSE